MALVSRNSSRPWRPYSRPLPDCLYPPNGASPPAAARRPGPAGSRGRACASLLDQGELTEASDIATQTLPRIAETASVRCTTYLVDLPQRSTPHHDHPAVT